MVGLGTADHYCGFRVKGAGFYVPCQTTDSQDGDAVPVGIELVPCQTVTRGLRMGVVVVVPAFAEGEQSDPHAIAGGVAGREPSRTPHVCSGVYEPGAVETDDGAEEDAPEEIGPSTEDKKGDAEGRNRDPMPTADPDVEFIFAEVGDVGIEFGRTAVLGLAGKEPADVGPEGSIAGRVRVAFFVGVLMMLAVSGNPEDRSAFESERGADGEEVLHPPRCFVAAMSEEAMVAHADAEASGEPAQEQGEEERLPTEHEECGYGAEMKCDDHEGRHPDDGLGEGTIVNEYSRLAHNVNLTTGMTWLRGRRVIVV
jgi:hypothetical protein